MEVVFENGIDKDVPRLGDFLYVEYDDTYTIYQIVLGIKDKDAPFYEDEPYFLVEVAYSGDDGAATRYHVCQSYKSLEAFKVGNMLYKPTGATITKIIPRENATLKISC